MTDKQTIIEMLQRTGIPFTEDICEEINEGYPLRQVGDTSISTFSLNDSSGRRNSVNDHPLSYSYWDFYSEFVFKPDGSLRTIGAWE